MKAIVAAMIALALVAGLPDDAGAQEQTDKQKAYAKKRAGHADNGTSRRQRSDYVEHLADKLPFGSSEWWRQMQREQRLGGETQ